MIKNETRSIEILEVVKIPVLGFDGQRACGADRVTIYVLMGWPVGKSSISIDQGRPAPCG